jgi:hypothetical protein
VETEEDVGADEKSSCILHNEVEKAIKEMTDKKATGSEHVPEAVLKLLGENGLKLTTRLIRNART